MIWIKSKFKDSDEGSGLITLFQSRPERYEAPLTELIEERAASDPQFGLELSEKVKRVAPHIRIVQKIDQADDCRVRARTAVRNFALLRKIAINLVRRHNRSRNSLRGRRKIAAWNNQYMRQVLTGIFHA
ncbi:hypothetical protein [Edaphobacter modestus]|uniref:DDE family transposase n=1 Tax=Edaphobacter modestus TaxID=388466 RepID=A0A4Q7YPH5_9BACT|nr:hypothetical protein [Edaphobacter modestus]RZU38773.1 hypothetical protein BDD14_0045 [Edaphobacter modestus]